MSKASIYEVAALAGVSIATVSRTLNQPHRVSESTRAVVMQAVHKLQYTPDLEAVARARHHNDRIAVVAPLNTRPGFTQRLTGISSVIDEAQAEMIIFQLRAEQLLDKQRNKFLESLASSGRYDGVIVISLPLIHQHLDRLAETFFPTVLLETSDTRFTSIGVDNAAGAKLAVDHLISKGKKRIGFLGFNSLAGYSIDASKEREQGYIQSLLENGRNVNPELFFYSDYSIADSTRVISGALKEKNRPDALFCAVDICALGALKAASSFGLKVPEDFAVVGFDDIEIAEYIGLTTIRQELEGSGREAAKSILALLKDNKAHAAREIKLPVQLVVRNST